MVAFAEHREVRVTARISVKTPFIAPDMAPLPTTVIEQNKGLRDWTDMDVKVPSLDGTHLPKGFAENRLAEYRVSANAPKVRVNRPSVQSRYVNRGPNPGRLGK